MLFYYNDFPRFWSKVGVGASDECWPWLAAHTVLGYGTFQYDGRLQPAHRVAYEMLVGPIPKGLELDHLCRVPACVNPKHLEPVTHRENIRRSPHNLKPYCKNGHAMVGDNVYEPNSPTQGRRCRQCHREAEHQRYHDAKKRHG